MAGVESGHQTASADFWERCDTALDAGGDLVHEHGRLRRRPELGNSPHSGEPAHANPREAIDGWQYQHTWTEALSLVVDMWSRDLRRRAVVHGSIGASLLAVPALRWSTRPVEQPEQDGPLPLDPARIDALVALTSRLRGLDNQFGGGHVRPAVLGILDQQVAPLLRDGRFDVRQGRQLLSAAAELTQLLAWTTHDVAQHALAQQYLVQALRLAQAADDTALGAEVLAGMSHQASFIGRGDLAVDLARTAQRTATEVGLAALVAEAFVMEAHGHAIQRDERGCTAALVSAERWFARAAAQKAPGWMGYFDEAYYAAKVGHCLKALGRLKAAEASAERSLVMDTTYVRGHAFNVALLATICARRGDVERAAQLGVRAVGVSRGLDSRRMDAYLSDLRYELEPFAGQADVEAFRELTADVLPAESGRAP